MLRPVLGVEQQASAKGQKMLPNDPNLTTTFANARSRITGHTDLLPGLDGRSAGARRFRDLIGAFVSDQGGLDACSEIKVGLIRRLAAASVLAEQLEAKAMSGADVDVSVFCNLASTTVRIASRLGLERIARDISTPPGVADYVDYIEQQTADTSR
jgi:hypothetical protein